VSADLALAAGNLPKSGFITTTRILQSRVCPKLPSLRPVQPISKRHTTSNTPSPLPNVNYTPRKRYYRCAVSSACISVVKSNQTRRVKGSKHRMKRTSSGRHFVPSSTRNITMGSIQRLGVNIRPYPPSKSYYFSIHSRNDSQTLFPRRLVLDKPLLSLISTRLLSTLLLETCFSILMTATARRIRMQ
jgi:hypothetical protein